MTLPISAKDLYRFNPLADAVENAAEIVSDAERDLDEARAKAAAEPDDAKAKIAVTRAERALKEAEEHLEETRKEYERNGDSSPVYLIQVPTFSTRTSFKRATALLPPYPSDRKMLSAMKKAAADGVIPITDPKLSLIETEIGAGGSCPRDLAAEFDDLVDRTREHESVCAVIADRTVAMDAFSALRVRHYLKGVENLDIGFRLHNNLVPVEVLDEIPLDHIDAIAAKINELSSVRARVGKSSAAPSSSPSITETATAD